MPAAILLAAGFSRRLGRPKQTAVLAGETLVERAVRIAAEAGLAPIFVVLAPGLDFGSAVQQPACIVILNEEAEEGIASSIRRGVAAAELLHASGAVLMTCDQVGLRAGHLRSLVADVEAITASAYAGRKGIPAYFPASSFALLQQLQGDTGARDLLRYASAIAAEELALDVDTEEDLARARAMFGT